MAVKSYGGEETCGFAEKDFFLVLMQLENFRTERWLWIYGILVTRAEDE